MKTQIKKKNPWVHSEEGKKDTKGLLHGERSDKSRERGIIRECTIFALPELEPTQGGDHWVLKPAGKMGTEGHVPTHLECHHTDYLLMTKKQRGHYPGIWSSSSGLRNGMEVWPQGEWGLPLPQQTSSTGHCLRPSRPLPPSAPYSWPPALLFSFSARRPLYLAWLTCSSRICLLHQQQ